MRLYSIQHALPEEIELRPAEHLALDQLQPKSARRNFTTKSRGTDHIRRNNDLDVRANSRMYYRPRVPDSLIPRCYLPKKSCSYQRVGVLGDDPALAGAFRDAQLLSDVFETNCWLLWSLL
jgi:hypothetical protein